MIVRDVASSAPEALSLRHNDGAPMHMPMGGESDAMPVMRPNDVDTNTNPCGADPGLTVTVNGVVSPSIKIAAGESQFFRVVNATGHKNMDLAVDGASLELVAIDGVALDAYPGTAATQIVPDFVLPPAARAEFVVTGTGAPTAFHTKCYNSGPTGDPDPDTLLATLKPGPGTSHRAGIAALPHLRVGTPLPVNPLSSSFPPSAAFRTVVLNEDANAMYINGSPYNPSAPPLFTVRTGTIEEWQVVNITEEVHDFHMHQVHFFVQSINGVGVAHPALGRQRRRPAPHSRQKRLVDARPSPSNRRLPRPHHQRSLRLPLPHPRPRRRRHDGHNQSNLKTCHPEVGAQRRSRRTHRRR